MSIVFLKTYYNMTSEPTNKALYEKVKQTVYKKYPKHSAYRSGILVKTYKTCFKELHPHKTPYKGSKPTKTGLVRWFAENWKSDTGNYKYTTKSSIYRPTKRITQKTPITFSELTPTRLKKAKKIKSTKGRVNRF